MPFKVFLFWRVCSGNKLVLNNGEDSISIIKVLDMDSEKEESIFQVYTEFRELMKIAVFL
ncbi:hypothetical protein D3C77_446490 [compost metagenome]